MKLNVRSLSILGSIAIQTMGVLPASAAPSRASGLKYCLPAQDISTSPFEPLEDPTKLFYLFILTKPYISTDPTEQGVLSKWQFSPDGLHFSGVVSADAKWSNGRNVTAREAALGIAKGMQTKPVGGTIKVKGFELLSKEGWETASVPGVIIKSNNEFELILQSQVKNPGGVLREALSTSSRANRMWPVRLEKTGLQKQDSIVSDFVSKFPLKTLSKKVAVIGVDGTDISLVAGPCDKGDFYGYGIPDQPYTHYTSSHSSGEQTILAVFNQNKLQFKDSSQRKKAAEWLREIFRNQMSDGIRTSSAHFLDGEPGFQKIEPWGYDSNRLPGVSTLNMMLGTPWPHNAPIRMRISEKAATDKIALSWQAWDGKEAPDFDIKIAGSRIQKGRQTWSQDILDDDYYAQTLKAYPRTYRALEKARSLSAATIPVDNETLQELEKATQEEISVVPVARYVVNVFSKKDSPIELVFTAEDEQTFRRRKK